MGTREFLTLFLFFSEGAYLEYAEKALLSRRDGRPEHRRQVGIGRERYVVALHHELALNLKNKSEKQGKLGSEGRRGHSSSVHGRKRGWDGVSLLAARARGPPEGARGWCPLSESDSLARGRGLDLVDGLVLSPQLNSILVCF